jgi:hypothetical protein
VCVVNECGCVEGWRNPGVGSRRNVVVGAVDIVGLCV